MSWQSTALQWVYILTPALSALGLAGFLWLVIAETIDRGQRFNALGYLLIVILTLLIAGNGFVLYKVTGIYLARAVLG